MIARDTSLPLVVTVACLCAVIAVGCADRATPPQASAPSATIVAVEGASTTYHTRDWNGKRVTVRVPSQSVTDIKDHDADGTVRATVTSVDAASQRVRVPSQSATDIQDKDADGTVRATVTSVDAASQRVRVRTSEGQTIVLALTPEILAGLKAGDRLLCTMPGVRRT